jgi:6,7-dimethyl-8-ribityllumazine synthase
MATQGNTSLHKGIPITKDAFIVIVKTEWNHLIADKLESGVKRILKEYNIAFKTISVPGAVEIPFIIKQDYSYCKKKPDAYITLGAVIKGETPHFDYVCKMVTEGISLLNMSMDVPVIFGVLTVNNQQEAKDRIGGIHGHKGEEAAITAIKMIHLNNSYLNC